MLGKLFILGILLVCVTECWAQKDGFLKDCLDAHNKYRAEHGVPPLVWNQTLADEAERWANTLTQQNKFEHDMVSIQNKDEGENLAYFKPPSPKCMGPKKDDCVQCREIVKDWYDEIADYDFTRGKGKKPNSVVLHFTQVVWKGSTQFGMATSVGKEYGFTSVARYYPRGNMMSQFKENVFPKGSVPGTKPTLPPPSGSSPTAKPSVPPSGEFQEIPSNPKSPGKCSRKVKTIKQKFKTITIITEECETPPMTVPAGGAKNERPETSPSLTTPPPSPSPPESTPIPSAERPSGAPPSTIAPGKSTQAPPTTPGNTSPQPTTAPGLTSPAPSSTVSQSATEKQPATKQIVSGGPTTPRPSTTTKMTTVPQATQAGKPFAENTPEEFKKAGLLAHNIYRTLHQAPPLKWNDELAKEAQAWADKIAKKGTMEHAPQQVRKNAGENLAMLWGKFNKASRTSTDMWYDEVKDYDYSKPIFAPSTGHFTQVVWKGSTELGMGRAKGVGEKKDYTFVVARYKPAGNMADDFAVNVFPKKIRDYVAKKRVFTSKRHHKHNKHARHRHRN